MTATGKDGSGQSALYACLFQIMLCKPAPFKHKEAHPGSGKTMTI